MLKKKLEINKLFQQEILHYLRKRFYVLFISLERIINVHSLSRSDTICNKDVQKEVATFSYVCPRQINFIIYKQKNAMETDNQAACIGSLKKIHSEPPWNRLATGKLARDLISLWGHNSTQSVNRSGGLPHISSVLYIFSRKYFFCFTAVSSPPSVSSAHA